MSEITLLREKMELGNYKLIRKRYIPEEELDISGDKIIHKDDKLLVTQWIPIHERFDISEGISYWFLEKGWKISKLYDLNGDFKHYYCDIARFEINEEDNEIKMIDLLVDVIIDKDGHYKVVDIDELLEAYDTELITEEELHTALENLHSLTSAINNEEFPFEELDLF